MKVYCYYLHDFDLSKYKGTGNQKFFEENNFEYVFYAFTNNKLRAKEFKRMRNMNIFFEKVLSMSEEEYNTFEEKYSELLLEYNTYNVKEVIDGVINSVPYYILSTSVEFDLATYNGYSYFEQLVYKCDDYYMFLKPSNFKQDIKEILEDVFEIDTLFDTTGPESTYPIDDPPYSSITISILELYLYLFKNTYIESEETEYETMAIL